MSQKKRTYKSFSVKLFDTWRIFFYGTILLGIILGFSFQDAKLALIASGIINLIIATIHIGASYTEVTVDNDTLMLKSLTKVIHLNDIKGIRTWWCYDHGASSIELGEGTQGKSRALSNKINCYVKFEGENEQAFIYEQIHLADKFPNGHEYLNDEKIEKTKLIRVWDIDKCLSKLKLEKRADFGQCTR